jgi:hypothetical protein
VRTLTAANEYVPGVDRSVVFRGRKLTDDGKIPVLRAYLKRWKAEVGISFEGTGPNSSDDQIRAIAPKHLAFDVIPVNS